MKKKYLKIIWFFIAFFCANNIFAQTQSTVSFDVLSGPGPIQGGECAPLSVSFNNTSVINPADTAELVYSWSIVNSDFGSPVDYQGVSFPDSILMAGNYDVYLSANNNSGFLGDASYKFSINGSTGKFDIHPSNNVCPGERISVGYNYPNKSISWDFGDGSPTAGFNWPEHTYETPNVYDVTLFLQTENCGADTITQQVTVSESAVPVVDISVGEKFCPYDDVHFDCNYEQDRVQSYLWDFGDGSTSVNKAPVHKYSKIGDYTVSLTITNVCGNTGSKETTVVVDNENIVYSDFGYSFEGSSCPQSVVQFQPWGVGNCFWDFGDGNTSTQFSPRHSYADIGSYEVTLIISNNCGSIDTSKTTLEIYYDPQFNPPTANIAFENQEEVVESITVCPGEKISFKNYSWGENLSYEWDMGYGEKFYTRDVTYSYPLEGNYWVKMTVRNNCQAVGVDSLFVNVNPAVQPTARLRAIPDTICSGEKALFYNVLSEMGEDNYVYDVWFGDDDFLTNVIKPNDTLFNIISHKYSSPGLYPYKFKVTNFCGNSDSITGQIVVDDTPTRKPWYYIENSSGNHDGEVMICPIKEDSIIFIQFKDTIATIGTVMHEGDPMPNIVSVSSFHQDTTDFMIMFNDDGEGCQSMADYGYEETGDGDTITFFSGPGDGCYEREQLLNNNTFFWTGDDERAICPGDPVDFTIVGGVSYGWHFGDGSPTSSEQLPSHAYADVGTYEAYCIATNVTGRIDTLYTTVLINSKNFPDAWIELSNYENVFVNDTVFFNAHVDKDQGKYYNFVWDFGDGSPNPSGMNPFHIFHKPGEYKISLTVVNGCGYSTTSQIVYVDYTPGTCSAFFSYLPDMANKSVQFNDESFGDNITNYQWDFGDGDFSNEKNPYHLYDSYGFYNVCLSVFDSISGYSDESCQNIPLVNDTVTACNASYDYEVNGKQVAFFNTSLGNITEYYWDFGDNKYSTLKDPIHNYDEDGYYNVCLTVFDSVSGCISDYCDEMAVIEDTPNFFHANFNYFANNRKVTFTNKSSGNVTNYLWAFDDGHYAYTQNPVHTYNEPGFYHVCLSIYDSISGELDEACKNVIVVDTSQVTCNADYSYYINGLDVSFTDNSQGNISNYLWDFGDGAYSYSKNPSHYYYKQDYYPVTLSIYDDASGCMDEFTKVLMVVDSTQAACHAQFTYGLNNKQVSFSNTSKGKITNYLWDFGDGSYSYEENPTHDYQYSNYYPVVLSIYDSISGCMDEFYKVVVVVDTTQAMCSANYESHSKGDTVFFTNTSEGNITDYFWDFDDGEYSYDIDPTHVYNNSGYYLVSLTSYDAESNCLSNYSNVIFVIDTTQENCNARFNFYTEGNTVNFTADAVGTYTNLFWDFDDGYNSNQLNPLHTYKKSGYYNVTFAVFDTTTNCFDTRNKIVFVEGTGSSDECKADFSYYPDNTTLEVQFSDKSYGTPVAWYWDFGDNSPANDLKNPVYRYSKSGYYRVSLTIINSTGNQKTVSKFIAVGDVSNSSTSYFTYLADSVTSTAYFNNESLGNINSYLWDFGDGYTSEQENPSHTYQDTGYYAVCLKTFSESDVTKIFCNDVRIGNALANPCLYSCVWPGDANSDLEANHYDIMTIGLNYDLTGPKRDDASLLWIGQFSQNWSTYQIDGTNNKYGDCNGDGIINNIDTLAIKQNFAYSHYYQPNSKAKNDWILSCDWDNAKVGASKARVRLSPPLGKATSDIYAIGYEILVKGGEGIIFSKTQVNFNGSWLGTDGDNLLTFYQLDSVKQKIYIGVSRIDHKDTSGAGDITNLYFEFKDGYGPENVSFEVTTQGGIVSSGENVEVEGVLNVSLGADKSICEGDTVTLDAGEGFVSYLWSTGGTNSQILVSKEGTYSVTVIDSTSTISNDTIKVVVNPLPTVEIGESHESADSVILDAGSGFVEYLWSDGTTQQTMIAKHTGHYYLTVTDENGCQGFDTTHVHILGITQQANDVKFIVFPNPNKGIFKLFLNSNNNDDLVLQIINIQGQIVYLKNVANVKNYKDEINVSDLPKGIYYLKVNKGYLFKVQRIVIN
ncbi:MAG: PKD domain-containing protein [Bacteroidetes bacterium]|nr:PKD domain-containing protein [Bacteroidota bacterium]